MDLAHFDAVAFARPARRPMVVVRLPNIIYRDCKRVVKFSGSTADGKVARRGAPQNVRAYSIAFSPVYTTVEKANVSLHILGGAPVRNLPVRG